MKRLDMEDEYEKFVAGLLRRYGAQRNFVKIMLEAVADR
jgi:hypothetical protein